MKIWIYLQAASWSRRPEQGFSLVTGHVMVNEIDSEVELLIKCFLGQVYDLFYRTLIELTLMVPSREARNNCSDSNENNLNS